MAQNWLRTRREALNLSQEDLASNLQLQGFDISRATVSHWEQGRHNPPYNDPDFVNALAFVLKLSVLDILRDAGYKITIDSLSDDERHVIESWRLGDRLEAIKSIVSG